jgi:hypothetical protein
MTFVTGLERREYGRRDPSRWPRGTLYQQKLALTSPTSGGRSVGIVRSRTQATEFSFFMTSVTNIFHFDQPFPSYTPAVPEIHNEMQLGFHINCPLLFF